MSGSGTHISRLLGAGIVLAAYGRLVRPRLLNWGSTSDEQHAAYPGDEIVPDPFTGSTMATTIAAPPSEVWPWLIQMGNDRAGFYSWDRLDNGGTPSADVIHPEWQDLKQGDRIVAAPTGLTWFDVAVLEPEQALVLRAAVDFKARSFSPLQRPPPLFIDGNWGFFLRPTGDGDTRLVVHCIGRGRPRALALLQNWVVGEPAHWVMQTKQFRELRRRAEAGRAPKARQARTAVPTPA